MTMFATLEEAWSTTPLGSLGTKGLGSPTSPPGAAAPPPQPAGNLFETAADGWSEGWSGWESDMAGIQSGHAPQQKHKRGAAGATATGVARSTAATHGSVDKFAGSNGEHKKVEGSDARTARAVIQRRYARHGARGVVALLPPSCMRDVAAVAAKRARKQARKRGRKHKHGRKHGRGHGHHKRRYPKTLWGRIQRFLADLVATPERVLLLLLCAFAAVLVWDNMRSRRSAFGDAAGGHIGMGSGAGAGITGSFGSFPSPSPGGAFY